MPIRLFVLSLIFALTTSCGGDPDGKTNRFAAAGDKQTLEQLAGAWEEVAQQWPGNPMQMPPPARRKFLEQVFSTAGYSYSGTLIETGKLPLDPFNIEHRDLCELLLLPGRNIAHEELSGIYTEAELVAVTEIKKTFP